MKSELEWGGGLADHCL